MAYGDIYVTLPLLVPSTYLNYDRIEGIMPFFAPAGVSLVGGEAETIQIACTLPISAMTSSWVSGNLGDIAFNLGWPNLTSDNGKLTASLLGGGGMNIVLPLFDTPSIVGVVGNVASIDLVLPLAESLLSSTTGGLGTVSIELPTPLWGTASNIIQEVTSSIVGAIPLPKFAASMKVGRVGSVSFNLPLLEYAGVMYQNGVGTLDVTLPVMITYVDGESLPSTVSYKAFVLNTKNFSVSEYPGYGFNSIVEYKGQRLGASGSKIYRLGSQNDNGTDIDMTVGTGNLDLTRPVLMLPRDMWLTLRSGKSVKVRALENEKDDDNIYSYESEDYVTDLRSTRVKLGRGLKGQSIKFEIDNVDGEILEIESVHLLSSTLQRRRR